MDALSMATGLKSSADVLFLMLGAVMVFAMHAVFAFLEVGTVRKKSQVNAFVKIISDWSISTILYFLVGFPLAYGISFLHPAGDLMANAQGYDLVHYFFLLCFAACIPASWAAWEASPSPLNCLAVSLQPSMRWHAVILSIPYFQKPLAYDSTR